MVVIDGQYSYAIYISISIYIHVNFNCMSEIHIFVVVDVGQTVLSVYTLRSKRLITWCRAGPASRADSFV